MFLEQVRNSIGYPHLNVKIGATHAGISVGEDGASHQCLEDLALMRTIPGMVVMCPADDTEARLAMKDLENKMHMLSDKKLRAFADKYAKEMSTKMNSVSQFVSDPSLARTI